MIKTIKDIKDLKDKRVLVRVDFDVAVDKKNKITDDIRVKENVPTIKYLLEHGAKVICAAKRRRPKDREPELSTKIPAAQLQKYLPKYKVKVVDDFLTEKKAFANQQPNEILVLENLRYYKQEKTNDKKFAKKLASLADIYVADAFAMIHRFETSIIDVPKYLPSYVGLLLEKEISGLEKAAKNPKKPLIAIIGGAKMETKIPVLKNLIKKANFILVGGGISNTYLWAQGHEVGSSLIDENFKQEVLDICKNKKIITPIDVVIGTKTGKQIRVEKIDSKNKLNLKKQEGIFDVGPATVQLYAKYIKKANTLILNGAMGYFEQKPYHHSTFAVTNLFATRSKGRAYGVCGGGETIDVLKQIGLRDQVDLVSTGGGAMLEFLAGKKLPGIEILRN